MKHHIAYHIAPKDLAGHLFAVRLTVAQPDPAGQMLALPAWIPGSYMIREFARNIVQISATCGGKPVALEKISKDCWQAAACKGALQVEYEVYAWDLSVRAAHLDQSHGFFNGTSVFLRVLGQEDLAHVVEIAKPEQSECKNWRVATSLPEQKAKRYGFGSYIAADYDELIDHPVEMGDFAIASFKAHGVPHDVVVTGNVPNLDLERLCGDLKKICEAQIAFFEPKTRRAPMSRYVFMTMAVGDGYGGLEHRASTALICKREDLPYKGEAKDSLREGYRTFLGLCSHEYFHTWNVKRIKPAVFVPYDLQVENYTPLLWLFEGFTSYYDDLFLVRCGIISEADYFGMQAKVINGVLRGTGRLKQSVADSSFDAWGKYYRQDENSPNAIVSYYTKGSLVAWALDLTIRSKTGGERSLDDFMRILWQRYGQDFYENKASQRGVFDEEAQEIAEEVAGCKLKQFFSRYVHGTEDLPFDKLLPEFGLSYSNQPPAAASLDVATGREGNDCKLAKVYEGGAAHKAGLSGNDLLIALDGIRVTPSNLDALLARYRVGDKVKLHAFRRDELLEFSATLSASGAAGVKLELAKAGKKAALPRPTEGV
ncbi:M61 family metallopeptidase [Massilia sp. W12]|uniref:M61 family metallopeptidase n=1 Tax=Massilia sp. W12 TaxID=3126507 RepID=UPI0030D16636